MKITYHRTTKRYVVSEGGKILNTTVDMESATRLAGIEPETMPKRSPLSIDEAEVDDLDFGSLFDN